MKINFISTKRKNIILKLFENGNLKKKKNGNVLHFTRICVSIKVITIDYQQ